MPKVPICKKCEWGYESAEHKNRKEIVVLCSLHSASYNLLQACKAALEVIEPNDLKGSRTNRVIRKIERAIEKATARK